MRTQLKYLMPGVLCLAGLLCVLFYKASKPAGGSPKSSPPRVETAPVQSPPAKPEPVSRVAPVPPDAAAIALSLRTELTSLKKEYERLLSEKQHEYEARRDMEVENQKLTAEKTKIETALSQLQSDRGADTARFTKDRDSAVGALKSENQSLSGKLQAALGELAPLKAREEARAAAVKRLPNPVVLNP
jgi:hypothetical protein